MARIDRLRVYPVKSLTGMDVDRAKIRDGGTLAYDREFAFFDTDGEVINGVRTDRVHAFETDFDPEAVELTVEPSAGESRRFSLDTNSGRERAETWFSNFFDVDLTLERDTVTGYVDRPDMGPSVVSTATLESVASWFDSVTVEGVRRRLRANVEISGVPPFWEDRFLGADAPAFEVGGIRFEGVKPCGRCVVPQRDPETGEPTPNFRERFVRKREETLPDWADGSAFDHYYAVMVITRVRDEDRGERLQLGDPVSVVEGPDS